MKKLAVVIIIFLILVANINLEQDFTLLDYFAGEYKAFSSSCSGDCVDLGFCYMYNTPNVDKLVGESIKIENFEPVSALKTLNARVVKTEYLDNGTIVIYAITSKISEKVVVDNKYVNLQIAHNDSYSIIGWPLILGSF